MCLKTENEGRGETWQASNHQYFLKGITVQVAVMGKQPFLQCVPLKLSNPNFVCILPLTMHGFLKN